MISIMNMKAVIDQEAAMFLHTKVNSLFPMYGQLK